ncbi:hypothetical protein Bp8pC_145 [Bacillus phage Bp8p-C]|uniref:Membrane-bound protein n=4 Tax=Agatevirus TaxID=1910931 RepID=A0A0A0PLH5_9CAUD|nr:hemolysin [Bacillus phage Bobb]YP_009227052.1 hemolysin [Bacillus phage Bp8p-C]YP_009784445.1 hypothetical protein QLX39_gp203 [Bacillus phage Bp8p-T]WNO29794.1 hypothetical protein [Bacillus phage SDFMU_Pbc]AHJ87575.1 hypothetical protein Bp8pC_145 [Bacillus phage Bp8p-C]AHJ87786.1 hypothetical protein Bp8pT_145 [Bacillus phage Bp8p-T]AII28108.1 hypothetical protein [Bacillus phage Bobb]
MMNQNGELIERLRSIEGKIQDQETDTTELRGVVDELKNIVFSLDKDIAIQQEKQSHLYYKMEQLQKELELLESAGDRKSDKQRELIEKALMAFLGGLITYLFSMISGK